MPRKRSSDTSPQVSETAAVAGSAVQSEKPKPARSRSTSTASRTTPRKAAVAPVETSNGSSHSIGQLVEAVGSNGVAPAVDTHEIARLAYSYWEARGGQGGSPEEDWRRAEQELRARCVTATASA